VLARDTGVWSYPECPRQWDKRETKGGAVKTRRKKKKGKRKRMRVPT